MQAGDLLAGGALQVDRLFDGAQGRAPADHQQVAFVVTVNLGNLEGLLQRGELAAAVLHGRLVGVRVVGDLGAVGVGQAGEHVFTAALAGDRALRQAGLAVPVIRRHVFVPWRLVDRRGQPFFLRVGTLIRLYAGRQVGVGEHDHRATEGLGQLARQDDEVETLLDGRRGEDDLRRVAGLAIHRRQQVGLFDLGRQAGRRAAALHVDDHQRHLGHHRQADHLGLQRHARAGGDGAGGLAGVRRPNREADGRDLVFGLVHEAADLVIDLGDIV